MNKSFGKHLLELSPDAALSVERESRAFASFAKLDALTDRLLLCSVKGGQVGRIATGEAGDELILVLGDGDREVVASSFGLSAQQARGAWFLPGTVTLDLGSSNLPYYFQKYRRFASGIAQSQTVRADFSQSPEALYYWAVLAPLMEVIYRPLALRSSGAVLSREEQLKLWSEVENDYKLLNLQIGPALTVMKFGGGWSKLRAAEQIKAKERLLQALAECVNHGTASLYRMVRIQSLLRRYYQRAKDCTTAPLMRQVLTKNFQRTLSAYFAGDWLSFVRYTGEAPHPEERIARALPTPKLYVTAKDRAGQVAATHAVAPAEIQKMLQAFWGGHDAQSPVERRVAILQQYWSRFDEIHSRQGPGEQALWGFVADSQAIELNRANKEESSPPWYRPGSYRRLLPSDLVRDIEHSWSGLFLRTRPDAIVSAINPHWLMAETFGPALRFWHGVALTAWFVSEGPYSRTDMGGLAKYHRRDLSELDALECPIDVSLFDALVDAEKKLGKPTPINGELSSLKTKTAGVTVKLTVGMGYRREGFPRLRDILSAHRRHWTAKYLANYLRQRWETEIKTAATEYNRLYEKRGKAPTLKQFGRLAETATNHWFGGDVSLFFSCFGEKSPIIPTRVRFLPADVEGFMWRIFAALGGKPTTLGDLDALDPATRTIAWNVHLNRKRLAELSPRYVQLCEGSGQPPLLKEFGRSTFQQVADVLAPNVEEAWARYGELVERTLQETAGG